MAKVQFNCRLEGDIAKWITEESERRSAKGIRVSQADVVTLLVNRASVGLDAPPRKKLSKKAAHVEALRASDVVAQVTERDDIEYGEHTALPSGQNVAALNDAIPKQESTPKADWRQGRKPLLKPKERKK